VAASPAVVDVGIANAQYLVDLAGIEGCTHINSLSLANCGVSLVRHLRTGLSRLKKLVVSDCDITSLEGLPLESLSLINSRRPANFAAVRHFSNLESLVLDRCGVTTLRSLSQLGEGLQVLRVIDCIYVRDKVLELPHVQPTADVFVYNSNVERVVLFGGVRRSMAGLCLSRD
jgi:hypothetical protein